MLKRFIILIGFISACSLTAADRPNIIFILCDDLGAGDIGVLWQNGREGKQKFSTPNLDQFAWEGMILSRHYCPAPICASSRSSLLTGRHQGHCAVRNTQFDKELPNEHTLGSVLQKAGYAAAAIGKWGLQGGPYKLSIPPVRGDRSPETEPSHPLLRGFEGPEPFIPRSPGGHHEDWVAACKGGAPTMCNFEYAGLLTEANHLGNVAYRSGKKIQWDTKEMRATNAPDAEQFIRRDYRKGWKLS